MGPTVIKWDPNYGREKGRHTRWIESLERYGPCIIFHSVTAKDLDISDLEEYDTLTVTLPLIFPLLYLL